MRSDADKMNQPKDKVGYFNHILKVIGMINNPKKKEIKVPVELCFFAIRKKLLPTLKIFLLLKMTSSGKCKLNPKKKQEFSEFCGYCTVRSFNNQLKRLVKLNWIGYSRKAGIYHIRGFENIQRQNHLYKSTGFWFVIQDMQCFDGVIYGAVIGYLSKNQGWKQRTDPERGRSKQLLCKTPGFYPISNRALAKILNISISTASTIKKRAEEEDCISIKRKRINEPATHGVYERLKEEYPEKFFAPIILKHRLYQRFPDLIKANLKYGTRKKIEQ
jgi:hypothetical protein